MANEERGLIIREEFGGMQQQNTAETAMAAVSAREKALVEARFVVALRNPRNWDNVRVRLLKHCDRKGFAQAAWYRKPTGRKKINGEWRETFAEDLSVRFSEVARQEIGNLDVRTNVTYEDDRVRIVTASVFDLERNNCDARDIVLNKVVEKSGKKDKQGNWHPPEGRDVLGERVNAEGEPVYLCRATEDEMRSRMNAEISKAQRDETKRLIPADILQDCRDRVLATRATADAADPTAARKKIIDAFAAAPLNVMPDELVTFIGCALEKCTGAQLDELRGLYTAIRDGETTMQEAIQMKYDSPGATSDDRDNAREAKIAALKKETAQKPAEQSKPADEGPSQEEMDRLTREAVAAEEQPREQKAKPPMQFGRKQQ